MDYNVRQLKKQTNSIEKQLIALPGQLPPVPEHSAEVSPNFSPKFKCEYDREQTEKSIDSHEALRLPPALIATSDASAVEKDAQTTPDEAEGQKEQGQDEAQAHVVENLESPVDTLLAMHLEVRAVFENLVT